MAEQVVIEFAADTTKLQPAVDLLEKFGQIDKQTADQFRKDTKEFIARNEALKAAGKGATAYGEESVKASKKASDAIKSTNKDLGSLSDAFKEVGSAIGIAFGVAEVINFGKEAVKAFAEAENGQKELLAALGGQVDVQQQLIDQAEELKGKVGVDDDTIIRSQTFLAIQGRTQAQISKTVEAAVQLAAVTGQDLQSAVEQLDATYEGNIGRLGKLDSSLKGLTREELANGAAVDVINAKYKGFAESTLNTTAGKLKQAELAFEDFKKGVGQTLTELVGQAITAGKIFGALLDKIFPDAASTKSKIQSQQQAFAEFFAGISEELNKASKGDFENVANNILSEAEKSLAKVQGQIVNLRNAKEAALLNDRNTNQGKRQAEITKSFDEAIKKFNDTSIRNEQTRVDKIKDLINQEREARKAASALGDADAQALAEKRAQALIDIQKELIDLEINAIEDGNERKKAQIRSAIDFEIQARKAQVQQGILTEKEFQKLRVALIKQGDDAIKKINKDAAIQSFADEETLRKQQTDNIIKIIQDQNTVLQTEDIEALNDRIKAKQEALRASGLDEVTIARQIGEFINEETRKLNEKRLNDEIATIEDKLKIQTLSASEQIALENELQNKKKELVEAGNKAVLDNDEKTAAKRKELQEDVFQGLQIGLQIYGTISELSKSFADEQIADIERVKNAQLAAFDEQIAANKKEYDARNIGSKQFSKNEEELLKKKQEAEAKARREEAAIRRKQFEIARTEKLLQVAIATATGIVNVWSEWAKYPPVAAALTALMAGVGAAQTAAILSQPTPKYFKGTPSLQSSTAPHGIDTVPILANRGEAIIPTNTTEEYRQAIDAIYYRRVPADYMNRLASGYGKHGSPTVNVSGMNIDYDKLGHALAFHMRGKKGVYIENWEDAATLFSNNTSPYRR
jgi:hypothetical protein